MVGPPLLPAATLALTLALTLTLTLTLLLALTLALTLRLSRSGHHVKCEPLVGLFTSLVTFGSALLATLIVQRELPTKGKGKGIWPPPPAVRYGQAARWAGALHGLSWYMQIHPGHAIFEGRKAALLDALIQSFMDGPLFIWMEVAFRLGYDPALRVQLEGAVAAQHAAWALAS